MFPQYRFWPKRLEGTTQILSVIIFGCVFALNIALNNFSLGYISIAVNLIIRSCLPLSTFLSQQVLAKFGLYTWKEMKVLEISLMVAGVFFACMFTTAKIMGGSASHKGSDNNAAE